MKKQTRYIAVDKKLITEGKTVDFDLYETNDMKTQMSLFLQSGSVIDSHDKVALREIERLYIDENERLKYESYIKNHLQTMAREELPIEEKSAILYAEATKVIDAMFHNPEALGNAEKAKEVVSGFVDIILHDAFAVESLMKITAHDYYTHTHSLNVSIYTLSVGAFLGMESEALQKLGVAALLHDLGKSKIEYEIINKNGRLSEAEYEIMKQHAHLGHKIALTIGITDDDVLTGIRHHHEKFDGNGYPDGLKEEDISFFARIIGLCDVFDALTTKRSYKDPMSSFEALGLMKQGMSTHLDMKLVESFIRMLKKTE